MIIRKKRRRLQQLELLVQTKFALSINKQEVLGPMNLEHFAYIVKYGGYAGGENIMNSEFYNSVHVPIEFKVWPVK